MILENLNRSFENGAARIRAAAGTRVPSVDPLMLSTGHTGFLTQQSSEFRRVEEYYEHHKGRVYAAIQIIARRIAGQGFHVGRVTSQNAGRRSLKSLRKAGVLIEVPSCLKRTDPSRVEIIEWHPLMDAIQNPNSAMTRWTLLYTTVMSLLVTGRSVWLVAFDKKQSLITTVPTTWALPKHKNGLFSSWDISPPSSAEPPLEWPGEYVVHFFFPDPANPLKPLSPVKAMAQQILADESISTAQRVGFRNGIHPTVALIAGDGVSGTRDRPIKLEPHQRNQLINWIRQEYAGVTRFGLPIVLDALIRDVKPLSSKPMEMAFRESADLTESQIYMGFGVNPISAGKTQDVNRASSAMAEHHLIGNTVNPVIDLLSEAINKTLVPLFAGENERLQAWIAPATPKDAEIRLRRFALAAKYASVEKNELRRECDLPAKDDGGEYAIAPVPPGRRTRTNGRTRNNEWQLQPS